MNNWEAKYRVLAAGLNDTNRIECAEKILKMAMDISAKSCYSLETVVNNLIELSIKFDRPPITADKLFKSFSEEL